MQNHIIAATAALAVGLSAVYARADLVVTFDYLPLDGPDSYWNGSDGSGGFVSRDVHFNNAYTQGFWSGFAYSNVDDATTAGWGNQYAAWSGTDVSGDGNYAVGYYNAWDPDAVITLPFETLPLGFYAVNTTYAGLSMRDGDDFAKQFTAEDEDWFLLTIEGFDTLGVSQGMVDFYLADFRSPNPQDHYILDEWTWVDLTPLGESVRTLAFSLDSSDTGDFGMNTPAYFAMDNFTVVPEPSVLVLLLFGLGWCGFRRRSSQLRLGPLSPAGTSGRPEACPRVQQARVSGSSVREAADPPGPVLLLTLLPFLAASITSAADGPFPPAAGEEGSTAIHRNDERWVAWATGWTNYAPVETNLDEYFMTPSKAVGPATGDHWDVVSLGDGGHITMTFVTPIVNGPGFDFAVFGNSQWDDQFLELAFVEVSSDGTEFFRFPNRSLTPTNVPFWDAYMCATNIDGLAGKYRVGYGVPFDLNDLAGTFPSLDVHNVRYVRIVDIVGDGETTDTKGHPIYDPTPSVFEGFTGAAGFDLEAVGVLNQWTPLHAWRVEHFGEDAYSEAAADTVSWSDDGVPNLMKYALGLDPKIAHSGPLFEFDLAHTNGGVHAVIRYERRADRDDVAVWVEGRGALGDGEWANGPSFAKETIVDVRGETVTVEAIVNGPANGHPSQFFRLRVTRK